MGIACFNLVDEPWIDVAGCRRQSLKQFFTDGGKSRNFGGNALDKMAMLRFMLALAHAAVELPDDAAWKALTPGALAQKILAYLDTWHDAFDLFGGKPFLQFPQLRKSRKALPYSALQPSVAVGNKPILTNWNLAPEIRTEELPLMLLRGCGFGLGGKKYDNSIVLTPGYKGKLNDKGKEGSGVSGTLIGFQGYLHSYLRGKTLLETIRLNMLTWEDVSKMKAFQGMGRPAWEDMPDGEDSPRARKYKNSYQGALLPLDKFYLLMPEEKKIAMTDGIAYPSHLSGLADPALTIHDVKNKKEVVWAKTQLRPWRELTSILSFIQAAGEKRTPFFLSCGIRKLPREAVVHVWTAGLQVSSNAGEQFISGKGDYIESDFTFPNAYIDDYAYDRFVSTMQALDACARTLYGSVAGYFKELSDLSGADIAGHAASLFWETAEKDAQLIIDTVFSGERTDCDAPPELLKKWHRLVAERYSRSCPHETARQLLAWSKCRPFARSGTKKESKNKTRN